MPQALAVDREQVRIVAVQIGVREAARQFELNEDTVSAWSAREGWFTRKEQEEELVERAKWQKQERQGLQASASKTAAEILRDYDGDTRLSLARGINSGARHVSTLDGQEILMASQQISHLAKSAALVHRWGGDAMTNVMNINLIQDCADNGPVIECPE